MYISTSLNCPCIAGTMNRRNPLARHTSILTMGIADARFILRGANSRGAYIDTSRSASKALFAFITIAEWWTIADV